MEAALLGAGHTQQEEGAGGGGQEATQPGDPGTETGRQEAQHGHSRLKQGGQAAEGCRLHGGQLCSEL